MNKLCRSSANSSESNRIFWESRTHVVAPIFKLFTSPLELVIPMSKLSISQTKEHVELTIRCRDADEFGMNLAEYDVWKLLQDIWVNMFDAKSENYNENRDDKRNKV